MVRSGLSLCLWSLLKMVTPLSHKAMATLHSSKKWLIVSPFSSHKQHRDSPIKPLAYNLSHVRMHRLITSQQKIETLGHQPPFLILFHLASGIILRVSVSKPMASFGLNLLEAEYPHLSLLGSTLRGNIFLESSAWNLSKSSLGPLSYYHLLSFHLLNL